MKTKPGIGRVAAFVAGFGILGAWVPPPASASPPGPSYTIQVVLEPSRHRLEGQVLLTWRNPTTNPVNRLCFHLYLNAFKNEETYLMRALLRHRSRRLPWTPEDAGFIEISHAMTTEGQVLEVQYDEDGTLAWLPLPRSLPPGGELRLQYNFVARLPRILIRTGHAGRFYVLAQWFPKLGVLREDGWHCAPFRPYSEFYADFGDYHVLVQVPNGYIVGATGRKTDERVQGDWQLFRFEAERVHDFVWFAGRDLRTLEHDLEGVPVRIQYPPGHGAAARRYDRALAFAMRWFRRHVGAYPYPGLTLLDPPVAALRAGSMEYPMVIVAGLGLGLPARLRLAEIVLFHQFGHQYWYGVVANDEATYPWIDEGLATYTEIRLMNERYGERAADIPVLRVVGAYPEIFMGRALDLARWEAPRAPAWQFPSFRIYTSVQFIKVGLLYYTLERHQGTQNLDRFLRRYYRRFRFHHVTPREIYRMVRENLGDDSARLFQQAIETSRVFDYGVCRTRCRLERPPRGFFGYADRRRIQREPSGNPTYSCFVGLRRYGDFVHPIRVEAVLTDGSRKAFTWDGRSKWRSWTLSRLASPIRVVRVDPHHEFWLDLNPVNNGWIRSTPPQVRGFKYRWWSWLAELFGFLVTAG